jgi:hypothetical protein
MLSFCPRLGNAASRCVYIYICPRLSFCLEWAGEINQPGRTAGSSQQQLTSMELKLVTDRNRFVLANKTLL